MNRKKEVCYWQEEEWKDDPSIVFSIVNAVKMAVSGKNKMLDEIAEMRRNW
jgi:hypothetical protein